jgi:hypothetical protein
MRSLFALLAAAFFAYNALTFIPPGVFSNEAATNGLDGEPASLALMYGVRVVCGGLVLVSLALLEWRRILAIAQGAGDAVVGEDAG